jgi:undecaprenyl diphosphate synthase
MALLVNAIKKETASLMKNNIKLISIGEIESLPSKAKRELSDAISKTKNNTELTLILALSYSGRWEIINSVKNIIKDKIAFENINENLFKQYLTTKDVPDPELLIRTSGEYRISNFLLWQIAYSELYFTDTMWPDFTKEDLEKAILDYQNRDRRFGKTNEQLQN